MRLPGDMQTFVVLKADLKLKSFLDYYLKT
jgi:hypothetical protein